MRRALAIASVFVALALAACSTPPTFLSDLSHHSNATLDPRPIAFVDHASRRARKLASAAQGQVGKTVHYDAAYVTLAYPGGDVPIDRGVCSDVVVRAFRSLGVDLQVEVHKDMSAHFSAYPHLWGLTRPDASIDHRRVPNLQAYFRRRGKALAVTHVGSDYWPGDIVTWSLGGPVHIGIVSTIPAPDGTRYCMVHNIGAGTQVEDVLFTYRITGHYRPL